MSPNRGNGGLMMERATSARLVREAWGLSDTGFSQHLLEGLSQMFGDGLLCDYTLVAEDSAFLVHKALFAAVSEYFRAVFRSGMIEAHRDELVLKGVSASGLR